jgi:hypothetical protein
MNKDTVIGIIGSVVLVTAMVVVFVYERNNMPAAPVVTTPVTHVAVASLAGSVSLSGRDAKMDNITAVGPTDVKFHLTWTATNGKDTLILTVTPPKGNVSAVTSAPTDSGDATVVVHVPAGTVLRGDWKVQVEFTSAKPTPLPVPIQPPAGGMTDASVSYSVGVTA